MGDARGIGTTEGQSSAPNGCRKPVKVERRGQPGDGTNRHCVAHGDRLIHPKLHRARIHRGQAAVSIRPAERLDARADLCQSHRACAGGVVLDQASESGCDIVVADRQSPESCASIIDNLTEDRACRSTQAVDRDIEVIDIQNSRYRRPTIHDYIANTHPVRDDGHRSRSHLERSIGDDGVASVSIARRVG